MRFSIIVPVYNVEKYIDRCMYTLTHQTFDDYEIIIVNDETPDNSMQIVQKYVDEFPGKIQVIHQKNTRQGGARNHGVSLATGEYILFVDSDDYVALNMLETVDQRLKETPCDILAFRHVPVSEQGEELMMEQNKFLSGIYHPAEDHNVVLIQAGPVNKAFRREFYVNTQFRFPEKLLYEDCVTRLLYAMADTLVVTDDALYYYVQSSFSSMRCNINEKMLDIITMVEIVLEEFKKQELYEKFRYPLECALMYSVLNVLSLINAKDPGHKLQIPIADYLKENFRDYQQNPYVSRTMAKVLKCIAEKRFFWYHIRYVIGTKVVEQMLEMPVLKRLYAWYKGI